MFNNIHLRTFAALLISLVIVVASKPYFDSQTLPDLKALFVNIHLPKFGEKVPENNPAPNRTTTRFVKPFPKVMMISPTKTPLQRITPSQEITPTAVPFEFPTLTPTDAPVPTQFETPAPTHANRGISNSKLGIFLLSSYSNGGKKIIANNPKVIKVMDPQSIPSLLSAVKEYKSNNPSGVVVLRVFENTPGKRYGVNDDAQGSADDMFASVIQPALEKLGNNRELFDYIETPNELDNTPGWETTESSAWLGRFWSELINKNMQYGIKTCIGSIPVGNPPGEPNEIQDKFQAFLPAFTAAKQNNGAICYHAYTLNYSTDSSEIYYSLRYRLLHQYMTNIDSGLSSIPFILSEGGVDQSGNPGTSGWQARGDAGQYTNWLNWFDSELEKDNYVIGVTLFQIGDGQWSSFDLEPVSSWLADHIAP